MPIKVDVDNYEKLLRNKPKVGQIIREKSGLFVPVTVQLNSGESVLFVNAAVDTAGTGWYLHAQSFGLKCMLIRESHKAIYDMNCGAEPLLIDAVRVVRVSQSALICELVSL